MKATTISLRQPGYRLITIVLGTILLAAAIIKGIDLQQFALQIRQYGILPGDARVVDGAAWFVVVVEAVLGAALLVNWRPKATLSGFIILMLLFIAALAWAIVHGGVSDCGCFGPAARRSPTQALIEAILLLVAAVVAWRIRDETVYFKHPIKRWAVVAACVLSMALPVTLGPIKTNQAVAISPPTAPGSAMVLQSTAGEQFDLGAGTFLLALISTDCNHCRESVSLLNEIVAQAENTLTVYGVTANDQSEIDRFIEDNFAFYPVLRIDEKRMRSLMGDAPLPQYLLIRNGQIQSRWQEKVPALGTLTDLATEGKGTGN